MKAPETPDTIDESDTDKTAEFLSSELTAVLQRSEFESEETVFDAPTTPAPWPPEGVDLSQLIVDDDDGEY